MISEEISNITKKQNSLHWENRKHVRGLLKNFQCLPILGSRYNKITILKDFPLRKAYLLSTPLTQRCLTSHHSAYLTDTVVQKDMPTVKNGIRYCHCLHDIGFAGLQNESCSIMEAFILTLRKLFKVGQSVTELESLQSALEIVIHNW